MGAPAHVLDRPVWASLAGPHLALALGGELARRYRRDVNVFAAARDDSTAALDALAALVRGDERVYVLQAPAIVVPAALRSVHSAPCVQMVATRAVAPSRDDDVTMLGAADAPEMLSLAQLTQPGPFLAHTHRMGVFRGIRVDGRLVAMAGERMRVPGHTEVSGVCTHPDYRGRGFARRLSAIVAAGIQARGETPFLHAWADHRDAIALYESLGFRLRAEVNVAVLQRADTPAADA